MPRRVLTSLTVALIALSMPGLAAAQDDAASRRETATGRALFEEGVALFDAGRLDEATDRFRRSLAIRRTPSVMFNLGEVLVRRGLLVEGEELMRQVAASDDAPAPLRQDARARSDEIAPRIPRLTVEVRGDARVRVDDLELSEAMIGVALPVDPGSRRIVAEVGARVVFERTVELAEGAQQTVVVALDVATPAEAARTVVDPAGPPVADAGGDVTGEPWFWAVVIGVVAALVVVGVVVGIELDDDRYFSGNVSPGRLTLP